MSRTVRPLTQRVGACQLVHVSWLQFLPVLEPSQLWCRKPHNFALEGHQTLIRQDGLQALQEARLPIVLWI
jgi:hypothetical protein